MKKTKLNGKAVAAMAVAAGLVAGGFLGAVAFPKQVEVPVPYEVVKLQNVTVEKEVPVEVIKEVEVEKIVEVDNGDLDFVLERLEDKAVIEDAEEIVAELKAEDEALKGAFDFLEDNEEDFFDMLEEKGLVKDEDEVRLIKVYDDFDDVNVVKSDFDDAEYKFELRYKIEDLDEEVKKYVLATVKLEDGEYELKNVVEE